MFAPQSSVASVGIDAFHKQSSTLMAFKDGSVVIATRGSALAKAQARLAESALAAVLGCRVQVQEYVTTGDRKAEWSLEKEGGKGLFTKELEEALLDGRADVAVHSAKDLPTDLPTGLVIGAFLPRETPWDVLVSRKADVSNLALIATSSSRRRAQLKEFYPSAVWEEIRGNVETRLKKTAGSDSIEATVLAAAGLHRLGIKVWEGLSFTELPPEKVVPAAGQGAIALQCRAEDAEALGRVNDATTWRAVTIERAFLNAMGGGCHNSTAAFFDSNLELLYAYAEAHGRASYPIRAEDPASIAEAVAAAVEMFLAQEAIQ